MSQILAGSNIYEVIVISVDPALCLDIDLKYNTIANCPHEAIAKVRRHLQEKNHFTTKINVDFVVHQRPFVE